MTTSSLATQLGLTHKQLKTYWCRSDVVGASFVGAAPTASSFSTLYLTSIDCANTALRRDKHLSVGIICAIYWRFEGNSYVNDGGTNIDDLDPLLFTEMD